MAKQPARRPKVADKESTEFYEAMPMAQQSSWAYQPGPLDEIEPLDDHAQLEAQARMTAIVTLLLVVVAAVAVGLALIWAIQTASQNLPLPSQGNTTRLEL